MTWFAKVYHKSAFDPKPEPKPKKVKKKINPKSKKRIDLDKIYLQQKKVFLSLPENQKCCVERCKRKPNTIEHTRGKVGYFDKEARDNDLPLLLDERFWKPCCLQHNQEFESNTKLSKLHQKSKLHKGEKK